jgi:hypothetical protein
MAVASTAPTSINASFAAALAVKPVLLMIADRYHNDTGPDIVYSKVVALFQLNEDGEAIEALTFAINHYPNIAKELIKTKHTEPRSKVPGYITLGGEDEAYNYWEQNRKHWTSDTIAYKTLKAIFPET